MMETLVTDARDVDGARNDIFDCIRRYRDRKIIYFHGWNGFGAAPVLRSIAQLLTSTKTKKTPELFYDRIIYVDCSEWISKRAMQRKIAEELELDHETMAMFDKHDEEDDLNGLEYSSRDVIRSVSQVIARTLGSTSFMMIFLNGSDDEVDINKFGISPDYNEHVVLWTFKRQLLTTHGWLRIAGNLRYTHLLLRNFWAISELTTSECSALLREEVAIMVTHYQCMQGIDLRVVTNCCLYYIFWHYCFHETAPFHWTYQAPLCSCDGILAGDITRNICNALHHEIDWECNNYQLEDVFNKFFIEDPDTPFLMVKHDTVYQSRPYRWIWSSLTYEDLRVWEEDMHIILATVSSLFLSFADYYNSPKRLPDKLFEACNCLHVLMLSNCLFSFASPPFLECHKLRFLGVDHCIDKKTSNEDESTMEWAFLHKLWVLYIYYTPWDKITRLDKIDLMTNLRELNIVGFCCWQYTSILQGRVPNLQRLRIIEPKQMAETSTYSDSGGSSLMENTKLEVLDLSGNRNMKNLPTSLSKASNLQMLILDGCVGLEKVVVSNSRLPSTLKLFSFDGYGPALCQPSAIELPLVSSRPNYASYASYSMRTSQISLLGCTQMENLFIRGMPYLMELDLSGSAIKVLDFRSMVVDVPGLRRLFLLGCQHLCAIRWGSLDCTRLDLVCVDTRPCMSPGFTRPSLVQRESSCLQLYAILADARLTRSLRPLMHWDACFYMHITSTKYVGAAGPGLEAHSKEIIEPNDQQHHDPANPYGSIFTEIIGDTPLGAFPQPPTQQLDCHIEISDGSLGLESELADSDRDNSLAYIMKSFVKSLHMHDVSASASLPDGTWNNLRWCRIERCPNMDTVFPPSVIDIGDQLEVVWALHLLTARSIWSKGLRTYPCFGNLQDLHLCSCPRLQFVMPVWVPSLPSLKTIHIVHCSELRHIFLLEGRYPEQIVIHGLPFPKLTTIHLYNLPSLQQICEVKMLTPALETVMIRGCFGLRRLPALEGREPGVKKPTVEMEKDVWDALEWEGLVANHQSDLYEVPIHSRYYKRSRRLRGTVLR